MNKKMKILICCNVYPPNFIGGAELVAHQQALTLVKMGHEVQIFTGDIQPIESRYDHHEDTYENLRVHRIRLTGEDYQSDYVNFSHLRIENHFTKVLKEFCPEVVHFHNIIGLSVTIIRLAKEYGAKTVLTLHDYWGFCFKNTVMKYEGVVCKDHSRCEECQPFINDGVGRHIPIKLRQDYFKLMMLEVDFFVSPSQYLAEAYLKAGFYWKKMHVIWNGIDFNRFDSIIHKKNHSSISRFSFFGHFGQHKGVATLLDALPYMKNTNLVRINLVGSGDQAEFYRKKLAENNCSHLVKFWGKLDNSQVQQAYAETDVLVLPSIWNENQPVSITEAMAVGIPVIASNMGGIPELVEHGKTGLIFEAGNAQDLAEKMDFLIDHPEVREIFGKTAKERMRNNTFENQVRKLLTIYRTNPPNEKDEDNLTLILCVGQCFDPKCVAALSLLPYYLDDAPNPLLVMADWITEQQRKKASLIWIVDSKVSVEDIRVFFHLEKLFLVPIENESLTYICRVGKLGLYYSDEHEAAACISYFISRMK